jgi:predicted MFS family arabinose efflux permease
MAVQSDVGAGEARQEALSPSYVNYALWMLLLVYTLNFLDRQIVNILAEPIKQELKLSDTQLGLMTGLAFAVVYTVLGIPIARYADKFGSNRVTVISIALAVWSGFTALCGAAGNFWQLLLARIGVGVGEAGCTPPAHSLIVDHVPPEKRASALALYSMGVPLGSLGGMALGGVIAEHFGWRAAFFAVGLPGVLLALITWRTLKEPRRLGLIPKPAADAPVISFVQALTMLSKKKAYWFAVVAAAMISFLGYGQAAFLGSYFARVHQMPIGQIGISLGLMIGIAGVIGTWIGGQIADRAAKKDTRAYMSVPAFAMLAGAPFFVAAMFAESALMCLLLLAVPTLLNSLWYGPVYAAVQGLAGPKLRATAVAIMLFVVNMIGLGLGPLILGVISDSMAATMGPAEGLRWAILLTSAVGIIAVILFFLGRLTIRDELEATAREG